MPDHNQLGPQWQLIHPGAIDILGDEVDLATVLVTGVNPGDRDLGVVAKISQTGSLVQDPVAGQGVRDCRVDFVALDPLRSRETSLDDHVAVAPDFVVEGQVLQVVLADGLGTARRSGRVGCVHFLRCGAAVLSILDFC